MRTPFIGGNWKMNGSLAELSQLTSNISASLNDFNAPGVMPDVAVFPSFVYLPHIASLLSESFIKLGAQNHADQEKGAFTGEISPAMLKEIGCEYALLGHSERRHIYHETSAQIAQKFVLSQQHNLKPILCVGETLEERESDRTAEVVLKQLQVVIDEAGIESFQQAVLAYEPVWAIGTGKTASPEQAQEVHQLLREHFAKQDAKIAAGLRIIYGGSVKPGNAAEIFAKPDVDGGLIGGASLVAEDFVKICQSMNQ